LEASREREAGLRLSSAVAPQLEKKRNPRRLPRALQQPDGDLLTALVEPSSKRSVEAFDVHPTQTQRKGLAELPGQYPLEDPRPICARAEPEQLKRGLFL
jgi:hypothetical protein